MHFHTSLIVLASALQLGTVFAQASSCPTQLKSYQPALAYCTVKYPLLPATKTVTVIPTTTTTVETTATLATTSKTTSAAATTSKTSTTIAKTATSSASDGGGKIVTITSIVEKTVTSCVATAIPTNCKPAIPSGFPNVSSSRPGIGSGRPFNKRSQEEEYYAMAIAEYESDLEKRQFGGFDFSSNPAFTWLSVLAKGTSSLQSVCSCIQTPSKTVTTTVTAKPTRR